MDIPKNAGQVASWKTLCPFVAIITEISVEKGISLE